MLEELHCWEADPSSLCNAMLLRNPELSPNLASPDLFGQGEESVTWVPQRGLYVTHAVGVPPVQEDGLSETLGEEADRLCPDT